ncbi:hypothetical protein GMA12_13715 [Kocuria sediminis]|uniref:Uncharacterized protein n=1 Tax=Kocuria sediminis TaxID=1038857 RepID=A0A6N8GPT5_9MICC|nr:hypothetical protein [Kocuria sediminis]MUN64182.1 hypothetical protein [Kocuria sediminis]
MVLYQLSYVRMSFRRISRSSGEELYHSPVPGVPAGPVLRHPAESWIVPASRPVRSPEPVGVPDRQRLYGTDFRIAKSTAGGAAGRANWPTARLWVMVFEQ